VLVAAMAGEAWEPTRAAFAEWIERVGGDTAELDEDAAALAALDAPARDRMRPFLLVRWRTRLEPLVLKDPGTGGGTGLWELAGRVCDLLPAAEQAWANAHQKRDFPYDLATAQALVDAYRSQPPGDDVGLAETLIQLSQELGNADRPADAMAATKEAVEVYRRLFRADPATHGPALGAALDRLVRRHGWWDIDGLREAVEVFRTLAESDLDEYGPMLVEAHSSLSSALQCADRHEEAVAAVREHVDVTRRLAAADRAYTDDLATAYRLLYHGLWNAGRREEAVAALAATAGIHRKLAYTGRAEAETYRHFAYGDPADRHADLAHTLTMLSGRLVEIGRPDEATAVREEEATAWALVAEVYRGQGDNGRRLRGVLADLGKVLGILGRHDEAVAVQEEAVALCRRLAGEDVDRGWEHLCTALDDLGDLLVNLGRPEQALAVRQERIQAYRDLVSVDSERYESRLAHALAALGKWLLDLRRHEEGRAACEEAVATFRRLAGGDSGEQGGLATALNNLGAHLHRLGRAEEALAVTEEAVEIRRRQVAASAKFPFHTDGLATALLNLAIDLGAHGRSDEALATNEEAVAIYRRLADSEPTRYGHLLCSALNNLACVASPMGAHDSALAASAEAVALGRRLVAANPAVHRPQLALALWSFAEVRVEARRDLEAALAAMEESVTMYETLAGELPSAYAGFLPGARDHLAVTRGAYMAG